MDLRIVHALTIALLAMSLPGCHGLPKHVLCPDEIWAGYCFSDGVRSYRTVRLRSAVGGNSCSVCQGNLQNPPAPQRPIPLPPVPEVEEDPVPLRTPDRSSERRLRPNRLIQRPPAAPYDSGDGRDETSSGGATVREAVPPNFIPYGN